MKSYREREGQRGYRESERERTERKVRETSQRE